MQSGSCGCQGFKGQPAHLLTILSIRALLSASDFFDNIAFWKLARLSLVLAAKLLGAQPTCSVKHADNAFDFMQAESVSRTAVL